MENEKRYNPERIRIAVCQTEFPQATPQALESELKALPSDTDFFCTAEHSYMLAGSDPKKSKRVQKVAELAKKYDINLVLGGFMQNIGGKNYFCVLFISRRGEIYCHQKKDKIRLENMGTDDGVFPSEYGKIGILICVEIEDHVIREACLKYHPKLIFNPALIISRGENPNFKVSSESISGKLEKYAVDHNVTIVRVDHPYPVGMSSTQIISPGHTYYFPCYLRKTMIYDVNLNEKKNFQSALSLRPPYTIRSYFTDNVGNRYRTHELNIIRQPVLEAKLYDKMMLLVSRTTNHLEVWNFNTFKVKFTLQRRGRIRFPENSSLMVSRKDNFICVLGKNSLVVWEGRRGGLVHDIEDLSGQKGIGLYGRPGGKLLNFMMDGKFVGTNGKNELSFYEKSDLKLENTITLGDDDVSFDEILFDPVGMSSRENDSLFTISGDRKVIQEWDVKNSETPLFSLKIDSPVKRLRFFDGMMYFSDELGNLFSHKLSPDEDEPSLECLIKEYDCGIRDFVILRNTDKILIIDDRNGSMKILNNLRLSNRQEGEEEEEEVSVCCYEFRQRFGIRDILFDGKTKVFTRGDNFLRIAQFQQNQSNIYLGNLLK